MEISVHRRFQVPGEPRERATHASRSGSLIFNQRQPRMCGHRAQTYDLLILRSPQLSFTSGPQVRAGMDLYRRYVGISPASKGRRCYLSQNIGPAVAGSAGPAPPSLIFILNFTIQFKWCTSDYKIQYGSYRPFTRLP